MAAGGNQVWQSKNEANTRRTEPGGPSDEGEGMASDFNVDTRSPVGGIMQMSGDDKGSDERTKWQGGLEILGCLHCEGCISAVTVQRRRCTEEDSRGNQQAAVTEQQQQSGSDSSGGSGSSVARSGSGS